MKKFNLFLLIFFISITCIFGQTGYNLDKFQPVAPDVFQFIKYGEVPVSEYTGIANISIPIYTIKTRDYELPINLTYHSGGIRVTEEASWVGLGWDMQLGNIIQLTQGYDDFYYGGGFPMDLPDYVLYQGPQPEDFNYDNYTGSIATPVEPYYAYTYYKRRNMPKNGQIQEFYALLEQGSHDGEPDILKANFAGHSFSFIQNPQSPNEEYVILDKKGYKIYRTGDINGDFGWKVITPDGVQYFFEEMNKSFSGDGQIEGSTFVSNIANCTFSGHTPDSSAVSSTDKVSRIWQITKIISISKDTISFKYGIKKYKYDSSISSKWEVVYSEKTGVCENSWGTVGPCRYASIEGRPFNDNPYYSSYSSHRGIKYKTACSYLNEIDFSNCKMMFYTSERTDYYRAQKLDSVKVVNNINKVVKTVKFNTSYFVSNNTGSGYCINDKTDMERMQRLKLNSVQEIGMQPYIFIYDSVNLPPKNSLALDYWGFYNGKLDNNTLVPNILRLLKQQVNSGYYNLLISNTTNNSSVLQYAKADMLEKITYPTGGSTTFDYELNKFTDGHQNILPDYNYEPYPNGQSSWVPNAQTYTTGFGLRIKSLTNWTEEKIISQTKYDYKTGKATLPLEFFRDFEDHAYHITIYSPSYGYHIFSSASSNLYSPDVLGSGNYIGYDTITVIQMNGDTNTNGKSIKYFFNNPCILPIASSYLTSNYGFNLPARSCEIENGLVKKEETYIKDINAPVFVKNYYYHHLHTSDVFYGIKHVFLGLYGALFSNEILDTYRYDLVCYYPILGTATLLDSIITYTYDGDSRAKSKQTFQYNSINIVNYTWSNKSSLGLGISTYYQYPGDDVTGLSQSEQNIIDTLALENRLTEKIRTNIIKEGVYCDETIIPYKINGNLILPAYVQNSYNNVLTTEITYDLYDSIGNIQQYTTRDGLTTAIAWGYDDGYPVIKAVFNSLDPNGTYSSLSIAISQSLPNGFSSLEDLLKSLTFPIKDDNNWKAFNQVLRTKLLNSLVTTYTFDPLIGITSQTDQNNISIYYNYDTNCRLSEILDNGGKFLKKYNYHYANQQ